MLGIEIEIISLKIGLSKPFTFSLSNLPMLFISTAKDRIAAIPSEIIVPNARPALPIFIGTTNSKSNPTFSTVEKIKKYKGVFEFPND